MMRRSSQKNNSTPGKAVLDRKRKARAWPQLPVLNSSVGLEEPLKSLESRVEQLTARLNNWRLKNSLSGTSGADIVKSWFFCALI